VLSLSNDDSAGRSLCVETDADYPRGCWLVEDRLATESEIQYVLANIQSFRIRASYPVYRSEVCNLSPLPDGTPCPAYTQTALFPLGFVGGYFDEIKVTKPVR
jgi:hypothetical protein